MSRVPSYLNTIPWRSALENIFKYFQTDSLKLNNAPRSKNHDLHVICMSFAQCLLHLAVQCGHELHLKNDLFGAT